MRETGRNAPCPCGSGRRYKDCCRDRHPRDHYVYVGFREAFSGVTFEGDRVWVHPVSGGVVAPDAVFSQRQYSRASGKDKVVWSVDGKAAPCVEVVLASYDVIWAIDTNTRDVGGEQLSASCLLECYPGAPTSEGHLDIRYRPGGAMLFRGCPEGPPERYAWARLVAMVAFGPSDRGRPRVAVVTDHDLGQLHQYNTRQRPICGDMYLPANVSLIYASADKPGDSVLNQFVAQCDRNAHEILKQLSSSGAATVGDVRVTLDLVKAPPPIADDTLLSRLRGRSRTRPGRSTMARPADPT